MTVKSVADINFFHDTRKRVPCTLTMAFALLAAAPASAAGADDVTEISGGLQVAETTELSGVTNRYLGTEHAIRADLTVDGKSYVRLVGSTDEAGTVAIGPENASAENQCPVVTVKGNSTFFATYRNSVGFLGETDKSFVKSSLVLEVGKNGGSGKFLVQTANTGFGWNITGFGLWAEKLVVYENATTDGDYIDFLQLDDGGVADIACMVNENSDRPARILFNGGFLRDNYMNKPEGTSLFEPAANCLFVLEGINGEDIIIKKEYHEHALCGGEGVLRFKGDCDVVLRESGNEWGSNRLKQYLWTDQGRIEWKQTGDLVLDDRCWLACWGDDQLPYMPETGIVRMKGNAILDLNGTSQKVRSLISGSSLAAVSNVTETAGSTLVFGDGDTDGVLSAKCCGNVNIVKTGTGTLVVSNATVLGGFTVETGSVVFLGKNTLSGPVDIRDGVKVFVPDETSNFVRKLRDETRVPSGVGDVTYEKTGAGVAYARAGEYAEGMDIRVNEGTLKFTGVTDDRWWRFTFKAAAKLTGRTSCAVTRQIELATIMLLATNATAMTYSGDGCLSKGMQTNDVPPESYADLQPGYCMHGEGGTSEYNPTASGRKWWGASALFDAETSTDSVSVFKTLSPEIYESDSNTWHHVALRLPDGGGPVASYGLRTTQWGLSSVPRKWMVESSADGVNWTVRDDHFAKWANTEGLTDEAHFAKSEFPLPDSKALAYFNNGIPYVFTAGATDADKLENVKLSVAANAVLDTSYLPDSAISVAELTVDCENGAGTITKFRPAENGTLRLVSAPDLTAADYTLPLVLDSVIDGEALGSWKVYADGEFVPAAYVELDGNGNVVVKYRHGLRLIVR